MMRYHLCCLFLCGLVSLANANSESKKEEFINNLLARMTAAEKIGQLNLLTVGLTETGPVSNQEIDYKIKNGQVGALMNAYSPKVVKQLQDLAIKNSRLKIPLLFGFDVIHGYRTIFPIPLAQAASWNPDLIKKLAHASACEAAQDGLHWTFSPMVDIVRDPRWGRVMESAGEDPLLASKIGVAMVTGYQGTELSQPSSIMACVKHFALYGGAEAGRDYNTVDMSLARMHNDYLPPYIAAINAHAKSVMTSFNEVNGIPATGNYWLMKELLRDTYRFDGLLVTDYTAINEMMAHGVGDAKEVTRLAINATTDMDMVGEMYVNQLSNLLKEKQIKIEQINEAVKRVLRVKWDLGLFKQPYHHMGQLAYDKKQHQALAHQAALESIVLLKNANGVLPLNPNQKIAFIGPFVKDANQQLGEWRAIGQPEEATSLWQALQQEKYGDHIHYAKGCNFSDDKDLVTYLNKHGGRIENDDPQQLLNEALSIAQQSEVIVAVLGEPFGMSGEAASRTRIGLLPNQLNLLKALKKLNKPIVLVLMNGRPLTIEWPHHHIDAIVEAWYGGSEAGTAISDVLFGRYNPSGKLTMTVPRHVGQIPIYYNAKPTGRPYQQLNQQFAEKYKSKYIDESNLPRYPFGYGLSYSNFHYHDLKLNSSVLHKNTKITASVIVTNNGKYNGHEIVQLYLHDKVASTTQPEKLLKGFKKIFLKQGESKRVNFTITEPMLRFYNARLDYVSEPGEFELYIGPNSQTQMKKPFIYE